MRKLRTSRPYKNGNSLVVVVPSEYVTYLELKGVKKEEMAFEVFFNERDSSLVLKPILPPKGRVHL